MERVEPRETCPPETSISHRLPALLIDIEVGQHEPGEQKEQARRTVAALDARDHPQRHLIEDRKGHRRVDLAATQLMCGVQMKEEQMERREIAQAAKGRECGEAREIDHGFHGGHGFTDPLGGMGRAGSVRSV